MGQAKRGKKALKERFVGIPHRVVTSDQFRSFSAYEVKLIVDLSAQYNGRNNGNLTACYSMMKARNWANGTLGRTLSGLINKGVLVVTRQGWKQRGKPTLLALTWYGIDEPPSHVEYDSGIKIEAVPLGQWYKEPSRWKHPSPRK